MNSVLFPHEAAVDAVLRAQLRRSSVNLTKTGCLYVLASIFQIGWLYLVASNYEVAKQWVDLLPLMGWGFVILWTAMVWCVPHLFFLGIRMIQISRDHSVVVVQTERDLKRQKTIVALLILGIILDLVLFPVLLGLEDKSAVVLASAVMGGRVLQGNSEAIFQYYGW